MPLEELILKFTGDPKGATDAADAVKSALSDAFERPLGPLQTLGNGILGMLASPLGQVAVVGGAVVGAMGAAASAVAAITERVIELGERGSTVNDVRDAFDGFTEGLGINGVALQNLRTGSQGLIDDFTLMKETTRAMSAGWKMTAEDATVLGAASHILADRVGGDVTQAFEQVSGALTTGRAKSLAMLGVMVDSKGASADLKSALKDLNEEVTTGADIDAKRTEILKVLRQVVAENGAQTLDFEEKIGVLRVGVKNFTDSLASAIALSPGFNALLDTLDEGMLSAFGDHQQEAITTIASIVDDLAIFLMNVAEVSVMGARESVIAWANLKILFYDIGIVINGLPEIYYKTIAAIVETAAKIPGVGKQFQGLAEETRKSADAYEANRKAAQANAEDAASAGRSQVDTLDKIGAGLDVTKQKMIAASNAGVTNTETTKKLSAATVEAKEKLSDHEKQIESETKKMTELAASLEDAELRHLSLTDVEKLHGSEIESLTLKGRELGITIPESVQKWATAIHDAQIEQQTAETMAAIAEETAKGYGSASNVARDELSKIGANYKGLVTVTKDTQDEILSHVRTGLQAQLEAVDDKLRKEIDKLGPTPDLYRTKYEAASAAVRAEMQAQLDALDAKQAAEELKLRNTPGTTAEQYREATTRMSAEMDAQRDVIKTKSNEEIGKLGELPGAYATQYGAATGAMRDEAQHQKDVINGTFDTLEERLARSGIVTREQMDENLSRTKTDFEQMVASGKYTTDQLVDVWRNYHQEAAKSSSGFARVYHEILGDMDADLVKLLDGAIHGWDTFKSAGMSILNDFLGYFEHAFVAGLIGQLMGVNNAWSSALGGIARSIAGASSAASSAAGAAASAGSAGAVGSGAAGAAGAGGAGGAGGGVAAAAGGAAAVAGAAGAAAVLGYSGYMLGYMLWGGQDPNVEGGANNPLEAGGYRVTMDTDTAQGLYDDYVRDRQDSQDYDPNNPFTRFLSDHPWVQGQGNGFARGGLITRAMAALTGPGDTVPLWGMPGERVLNVPETMAYDRLMAMPDALLRAADWNGPRASLASAPVINVQVDATGSFFPDRETIRDLAGMIGDELAERFLQLNPVGVI